MNKPVVFDLDDLCDATLGKLELLQQLKQKMPALQVTLFTVPTLTSRSTIDAAKSLGPWIALGMHGWGHTLGECWSWTDEEAEEKMRRAADAGIDAKVLKAPKWVIDADTYEAAKRLGWVIADHKDWRIIDSGCRVYTYNKPLRNPRYARVHGHLPDVSGNGIAEAFDSYVFDRDTQFVSVYDAAEIG